MNQTISIKTIPKSIIHAYYITCVKIYQVLLDLPTVANEALNAVTPIPLQTFEQLNEPDSWSALGLMIADSLGASVNTQK